MIRGGADEVIRQPPPAGRGTMFIMNPIRCAIALTLSLFIIQSARGQQPPQPALPWWPPAQLEDELKYETMLNAVPTAASLRAFHDLLASEPHIAGTPGDAREIQTMQVQFRMLALEVQAQEFWAYLAKPIDAKLEIISPAPMTLSVKEQELAEDHFTKSPELTLGFNAYSGSGDVTAEVVYANYGTKADFEKLKEVGIDCAGKIVIARYGGNYRGFKAKFAEAAGAAGLIIYTDPDDGGYRQGLPYPEGGWANETYIQRGSIDALDYPGDPLTPGEPATQDAKRLDPNSLALPHIPVQPIGYGAAREILSRMKGTPLPRELVKTWQGGLPFHYRYTGGPDLKVHLMVKQDRSITKTANVTATIKGSKYPQQKIIIGCHHDAWGYGAGDPLAGTILVFEAAQSFADVANRSGHPPDRTIVFACWGAEEYGIIGSTEYCEQNREELMQGAVAYINLDAASMGPNFNASASPSLRRVIEEVAHDVPQAPLDAPKPTAGKNQSVYQAWVGDRKEPEVGDLGGGSDHVGFYCHLGIPSCAMGGEGGNGTAYHSIYDDLTWYRKAVGEDYQPALMLSRMVNLLAARLANAAVLPIDPVRYAIDSKSHLEALQKRAKELKVEVDFKDLIRSIDDYQKLAQDVGDHLMNAVQANQIQPEALRQINDVLLTLERCWLLPPEQAAGQPWQGSQSWFRNMYAQSDPESGYAAWMLPALRWPIEQHADSAKLEQAQQQYQAVFQRLTERMKKIDELLNPAASP